MNLYSNKFYYSTKKLGMCFLFFVIFFLSGCGGGSGSVENKVGALLPKSIVITPPTSTVSKGALTHFTVSATYNDGSTAPLSNGITWTISDSTVATIDSSSGATTGVNQGPVTVTATVNGGPQATASVYVTSASITGITISSPTTSSPKGKPVTFTAMASYSDHSPNGNVSGSVTWTSSDTNISTLDIAGQASTLNTGITNIAASITAAGGNIINSSPVTLTVTNPVLDTLAISSTSTASVPIGGKQRFTASGTLTDGTPATLGSITWTSSDTSKATVDSTGLVTGASPGFCTITASNASATSNHAAVVVNSMYLIGGTVQGGTPLNLTTNVSTFAGKPVSGAVDATGLGASFNHPGNITTDGSNLYVADTLNNKIRKIEIASGIVTTVAGSGTTGSADLTGPLASFNSPTGITTDGINLFVTDTGNNKIRQIAIATGIVTTMAGSIDNTSGPATAIDTGTSALFNSPTSITTDGSNLYVIDSLNVVIRKIEISSAKVTIFANLGPLTSPLSPITTDGTYLYYFNAGQIIKQGINGNPYYGFLAGVYDYNHSFNSSSYTANSNGNGTGLLAFFFNPVGLTTDGVNLYVSDANSIRKVVISSGVVTTLAGQAAIYQYIGYGTPYITYPGSVDGIGTIASFFGTLGIVSDGTSLYVADTLNNKIRKIQ